MLVKAFQRLDGGANRFPRKMLLAGFSKYYSKFPKLSDFSPFFPNFHHFGTFFSENLSDENEKVLRQSGGAGGSKTFLTPLDGVCSYYSVTGVTQEINGLLKNRNK